MNYKYNEMNIYKIKNILRKNNMCILALNNEYSPYLVPMYYKLNNDCEDDIIFTLHSSDKGKKMGCIKKNDKVTILVNDSFRNKNYSILGVGRIYLEEFKEGLLKITLRIEKISGRVYSR